MLGSMTLERSDGIALKSAVYFVSLFGSTAICNSHLLTSGTSDSKTIPIIGILQVSPNVPHSFRNSTVVVSVGHHFVNVLGQQAAVR